MTWEIECPACGGLVEAGGPEETMALAAEHCRDAHDYRVPEKHLRISLRHPG